MSAWIDIFAKLDATFLQKPKSITITAPNGTGKTTSICRFVARVQSLDIFKRIYVVVTSHEIGRKVVSLLQYFGAQRIIHYIGIEKVCMNVQLLERVKKLGLPPSFACRYCPYSIYNIMNVHDKTKQNLIAVKFIKEKFKQGERVIDPLRSRIFTWKLHGYVCVQPVIKRFSISPQLDSNITNTIIIVVPYSLFSSKPIIISWRCFFKRQRSIRNYLAVFDECDNVVYSGFIYRIAEPKFTQFDRDILRNYATRNIKPIQYIDFYEKLYDVLDKTAEGYIDPDDCVDRVIKLYRTYHKVIRKVQALSAEIAKEAFLTNNYTFVVSTISEVYSIEYFTPNMAMALDKDGKDTIVQDLDYAYRILYDVQYPFRYFWKISTTATFPTADILMQSRIIDRGKECIEHLNTINVYPTNVILAVFTLFPELYSTYFAESRNELIEQKIDKIINLIKQLPKKYQEATKLKPRGMIIFTGNKKQYNVLKDVFSNIITVDKDGLFMIRARGLDIYVTYCASKYSRGLDFDQLDISIVLAPLLRPPRANMMLDTLDIAKATAETIQSLFRIVRSLNPDRPKMIGLESTMLSKKLYLQSFPTWFIELLNNIAIERKIITIKV